MRLIAHRGRRGARPENSLAGLADLAVLPALSGIEVDVQVSADGVPMLMHDKSLDRVTNGEGLLADTPFSRLQRLRLVGGEEPPPRLDRYLEAAARVLRPGLEIFLDIKTSDPAQMGAVARVVCATQLRMLIICLCKSPEAMAALRATLTAEGQGQARLGLLHCNHGNLVEKLDAARRWGAEILFLQHGEAAFLDNIGIIQQIHDAGFQAGGSILNGPDLLQQSQESGCDCVITDFS